MYDGAGGVGDYADYFGRGVFRQLGYFCQVAAVFVHYEDADAGVVSGYFDLFG